MYPSFLLYCLPCPSFFLSSVSSRLSLLSPQPLAEASSGGDSASPGPSDRSRPPWSAGKLQGLRRLSTSLTRYGAGCLFFSRVNGSLGVCSMIRPGKTSYKWLLLWIFLSLWLSTVWFRNWLRLIELLLMIVFCDSYRSWFFWSMTIDFSYRCGDLFPQFFLDEYELVMPEKGRKGGRLFLCIRIWQIVDVASTI